MDRSPSHESEASPRLLAGLSGAASRPVEETASRIDQALEQAGSPGTAGDAARQLDQAVISAITAAVKTDFVLKRLDPERLRDLLDRLAARLEAGDADPALRRLAWDALDLIRRPAVLSRVGPDRRGDWADSLLRAMRASRLTVGPLFRQRAKLYGSKVLFEWFASGRKRSLSWGRAASRVGHLARSLLALGDPDDPAPIAFLSENRLEVALLDLACLSSGLVNVMVPANATESDVGYILRHSGAGVVIVSGEEQLRKVLKNREALGAPGKIVTLDRLPGHGAEIRSLDSLAAEAERVPPSVPLARSESLGPDDLATVMYTSGTTGTPKGIQFSHGNIVFKRFARALALPEIGDEDVFLCFLPLFHTFGRFLEMLGCVFWGAKYCFLTSTSVEGLARGMRRFRPTVFISVPKKWIQLHELITQQADPLEASDEELLAATRNVTGGRLRWGLSAAGHLDSEIFRFLQRQGVELLSGFGMTEATGGITMTPPGRYKDGSLGTGLPGIELKLADDGELLIRGPYVMKGYLAPPDGEPSFDDEGWLHSGDLMQKDEDGHYRLVDRKKEIYKNLQGETIAPQWVENQFRDFGSVGRAFLVGDHREYNTLLIHPNPAYEELDLEAMSSQELRDHFRSLVVSVNKFLAPYERIVDFAIIDRDLDAERGELTPKGTPRRKIVERNFTDVIRQLYRRTSLHVGGVALRIPNWLFQILGLTAQDIRFADDRVTLPSSGASLTVLARNGRVTQVGSCLYRHRKGPLDLGRLLTVPGLWLGNEELVEFVPLDAATRRRTGRGQEGIEWTGRPAPYRPLATDRERLEAYLHRSDLDLMDLDLAARMLASDEDALLAVAVIERILDQEEGPLSEPARLLLGRVALTESRAVRRRAVRVLLPAEKKTRFRESLWQFLSRDSELLDEETRTALSEETLSEDKLNVFVDLTRTTCLEDAAAGADEGLTGSLLSFLAAYGAAHPMSYRRLRALLVRVSLFAHRDGIRGQAARAAAELQRGFRQWLGSSSRIAVDPETGQEYRWEEVVVFDEEVPEADRRRLLSALKDTPLLREAVFLFSTGASIRLSDIPPSGIWIRLLGKLHGKSVYRVTVQTRFQGSYDLAVNVNHDLNPDEVQEEIHWLILGGDRGDRDPLVEDVGGYWPEQDLWSEEFIAGETLLRAMRRLSRQPDEGERMRQLWPFQARTTLDAYVDFWDRSGKRLEIADPGMTNVVVPTEDYVTGVRIVSISRRRPHLGLLAMMNTFRRELVEQAEEQFPAVRGLVGWDAIFSAVLDVVGERQGLALFHKALDEKLAPDDRELESPLRAFLESVEARGFAPIRLHFAIERYRRWATLSSDATLQARALTLQELYDTYGLERLSGTYPEIRVRFFLETAFQASSAGLSDGLWRIVRAIRDGDLAVEELIDAVDELRAGLEVGEEEEYFLARLSYPYLRPEAAAGFVRRDLGGKRQSEIVVTLEDRDGHAFRVRHALNPKEVERLLRLFMAAKLDVRFRMEHQHLVAINERAQIIAGIYYEIDEETRSAHLEKIVVADRYRRKGVADGLMNEFFNRLRAAGVTAVTTGFFRPEYFYGYGFRIEKRYAGLVKSLEEESAPR